MQHIPPAPQHQTPSLTCVVRGSRSGNWEVGESTPTAEEKVSLNAAKSSLLDPEVAARGPGRKLLANSFGVPAPPKPDRDRGLGPGQKAKNNVGKRIRKKTTKPGVIVEPKYRHDPAAVPPISEEDAAKGGIYELVNRGFVGPDADITAALRAQLRAQFAP